MYFFTFYLARKKEGAGFPAPSRRSLLATLNVPHQGVEVGIVHVLYMLAKNIPTAVEFGVLCHQSGESVLGGLSGFAHFISLCPA
jgi:hypothetical protein